MGTFDESYDDLEERRGRKSKVKIGDRFGRLTVIARYGTYRSGNSVRPVWLCKCDCGGRIAVIANSLQSGKTRSCGCLRAETSRENLANWQAMKCRENA